MFALDYPTGKDPQAQRGGQRGPYSVSVSTIADLGKNFTQEEQLEFQDQLRITRRTSFKNIRGCSEAVWTLQLEAALLQGLFHHSLLYGTKERAQKRKEFINRNSFLSKFIFETTNQVRTPKQVSSRLQQLGGTTRDERVIRILRRCPISEAEIKPLTTPRPLIAASDGDNGLDGKLIRVPSTIVLPSARYPSLPPEIALVPSPQSIQLRTLAEFQPQTQVLGGMDPTVILLSPIALAAHSTLRVCKDKKPYWTSPTSLVPNGIQNGYWRYLSSVAADLWPAIAEIPRRQDGKRTQWSISHTVFYPDEPSASFAEISYEFEFELPSITTQTDVKSPRIESVLSRERKASASKNSLKCIQFSPPLPTATPPRTVNRSGEILPIQAFNLNQKYALPTLQKPTTPFKSATDVSSRDMMHELTPGMSSTCCNNGGDGSSSSLIYWNKLPIEPAGTPRSYGDGNHLKRAATAPVYSRTGHLNHTPSMYTCQGDSNDLVWHGSYTTSWARPSAAYSVTGEFMGCYPIHEY
ncbi:hypothetical protein C8R43DRAFT_1123032 [Mycena crocata]|nr:hypothetical protein C8R43DRAFT_1123032 [Mycena crocata]